MLVTILLFLFLIAAVFTAIREIARDGRSAYRVIQVPPVTAAQKKQDANIAHQREPIMKEASNVSSLKPTILRPIKNKLRRPPSDADDAPTSKQSNPEHQSDPAAVLFENVSGGKIDHVTTMGYDHAIDVRNSTNIDITNSQIEQRSANTLPPK